LTNFDFLKDDPQFSGFADAAIAAERILPIDAATAVLDCRRAMEFAVKWMYSVDSSLVKPWDDKLISLMSTEEFHDIVDDDLWRRMDFIRKRGNDAAHGSRSISREQAELCLENLFLFLDFVAYCYGTSYQEKKFDASLLTQQPAAPVAQPALPDVDLDALIKENAELKAQLTARRETQQPTYVPKPLELSEYKTRKLYIDSMLTDAGWVEGKNWVNEVPLPGMPNKSGTGYADYVLYGDDGRALAVIEAKRTCKDVAVGRQQAKLYADILEKQFGRRPVVFLTNGFDTRIVDNIYPERKVASIYSKRDLEKWFNLQAMRTSLANVDVNKNIAGRYYQEGAIKAVCDSFGRKNRRKALLVMATGSGKTRTVIALVDVLLQHGWVKNVLFLADRNSLVTQAKRSFVNLLPELSVTNLCEDKDNFTAHCVFSTYQTMMNCIDSVHDAEGKLFTCGHFDLIICDEAHRSIYNKYRDIFHYFDAPLVGLTATPKDEIDKNTYEIFDLENGVPTYGYELAQAVKDGFLVDFLSVESEVKFMKKGITYAVLPQKVELPIAHLDRIELFSFTRDAPISIDSKVYFESYTVTRSKSSTVIRFGKGIQMSFSTAQSLPTKFNFTLSGTLSERIKDAEFMVAALSAHHYEINGGKIAFSEADCANLPTLQKKLSFLLDVKKTLEAVHATADLDCSSLSVTDNTNLSILRAALIDKEPIKMCSSQSLLRSCHIANLELLLWVVPTEENSEYHNIYDFNYVPLIYREFDKNDKEYPSTHFVMLNKDAMLKYCNIDYNALLDAVQHVPFSEDYSHSLNTLLLEMLKAYDESKNSRIELLSTATALALWIKDSDPYTEHPIAILNYLQSVKRSRTLTSTEQAEILSLIEATQDNESIYVGAYLLLDNPVAAKIHFDKLPEESQKFFESCPIYHFMPNGQPTVSALTEG